MEGVHLDQGELIRTFGLTRRTAVRVGALLGRGLAVTPTLLEIAGAGSPMERLLLHPALLDEAATVETKRIQQLASETGADSEGPLAIVDSEGERVLALEEELLAEEAWEGKGSGEPRALTARPAPGSELGLRKVLEEEEAEQIFSPEEIARIKLEAVAGRDAEARISALRKLTYTPLSPHEKGSVFLRALVDSAGSVRAEALRSLEALGFNRDTADALKLLLEAKGPARTQAVQRVCDLMEKLEPGEKRIAVLVLVEAFRDAPPQAADDPLLGALCEAAPGMAEHPEIVHELTRVAVQHLLTGPAKAQLGLRGMILDLAGAAPEPVVEKLWEEVETVRAPNPRATLLSLLMALENRPGSIRKLCDRVTHTLLAPDLEELPRQTLGYNLVALGEVAGESLLAHYRDARQGERERLVPFLDALCMEEALPAALRDAVAEQLVESLRAADRGLHMQILRTRSFNQTRLKPHLQQTLISELIATMKRTDNAEIGEHAALMLESLGCPAAKGLFDLVRNRPSTSEADRAVRALATVLAAHSGEPGCAKWVEPCLDFCRKRVAEPGNRQGGYAWALGTLTATDGAEPHGVREVFELMMDRLQDVSYAADVVSGLGMIAAGPAVTAEQRVRVVHTLSQMVDRPADSEETTLREVPTKDGVVYEVTGDIAFQSETLPAAIHGLEQIALSPSSTDALREQIVEMFLRVWGEVAAWRLIWGPRSAEQLAGALGRIGADERTEDAQRVRMLDALAGAIERISVVRSIDALFAVPAGDETFNTRALNTAERMLDDWIEPEIAPGELEAVLRAAARAAARPELNPRRRQTRDFRNRTAEMLFDALRHGQAWTREPLEWMRDCPTLPKALRAEIADRLQLAFALVAR